MAGVNFGELVKNATFSTSGQTLPEGRYTAEIRETSVDQTQAGNDRIQVTWVIVEGDEAGRKIKDNRSFVIPPAGNDEKAKKRIDRFFGTMATLGLSRQFFQSSPSLEQLAKALEGRRADVVTENREFNGREYPNVKWVNSASVKAPASAGPAAPGGFTPPAAASRPTGFTPPPIGQVMRPAAPPAPSPTMSNPPEVAPGSTSTPAPTVQETEAEPQPVDF